MAKNSKQQSGSDEAATETQPSAGATPKKAHVAVTPVKKITVASVHGIVKARDLPPPSADGEYPERFLFNVAGYASGVIDGFTQYGKWEALTGEFAAQNARGERFAAKTCIVPGAMGDYLIQAMRNALEADATASVHFAVAVSVKVSARDDEKYEYVVRALLETDVKNPAMDLLANVAGGVLTLEQN